MKKLTSTLGVALLSVFFLTSCGDNGDEKKTADEPKTEAQQTKDSASTVNKVEGQTNTEPNAAPESDKKTEATTAAPKAEKRAYSLPKGYKMTQNHDDKPNKVEADFDGDGVNDMAAVISKNEDNENLIICLSSKSDNTLIPIDETGNMIESKNGVIIVGGCYGNGRNCEKFKFKYYSDIKTMKMIGYDNENFGNAVHDGAYNKSINLGTGDITLKEFRFNEKKNDDEVINDVKKKLSIRQLTIDNLKQSDFNYVRDLGNNLFKKKILFSILYKRHGNFVMPFTL